MKTSLATIGSGKLGFSQTGKQSSGQPEYIGGMRGVAERNTMRYYLAIDATLGALAKPPPMQLQKRLHGVNICVSRHRNNVYCSCHRATWKNAPPAYTRTGSE